MPKPINVDHDHLGSSRITNLPAPLDPADAATKEYVDNASGGGSVLRFVSTEVNFGTKPVSSATFTFADAAVVPTTRVIASITGATSSTGSPDDGDWDAFTCSARCVTGQVIVSVHCVTGSVVGRRILQYIVTP